MFLWDLKHDLKHFLIIIIIMRSCNDPQCGITRPPWETGTALIPSGQAKGVSPWDTPGGWQAQKPSRVSYDHPP